MKLPPTFPLRQAKAPAFDQRFYNVIVAAANGAVLINPLNSALTLVSMTIQVASDCTVQLYQLGQPITTAYVLKANMIWSLPSRYIQANTFLTLRLSTGVANVETITVAGIHPEELRNHENRFYLATVGTAGGSTALTINPQTGTSYAIQDSDNGKVITQSNTAAANWTLAAPGALFVSGWWCRIKNINAGFLTITISGANCDGATVILVPPGSGMLLLSNGSNFEALDQMALNVASTAWVMGGMGKWSYVRDVVNAVIDAVANQTRISSFYLQQACLVNKVSFQIQTAAAGSFTGAGLFSPDGNVKLLETGAVDSSTTGLKTVTLASTFLLLPGLYQYAYTASDVLVQAVLLGGINSATLSNIGTPRVVVDGFGANASVGGVLPATLGVLSAQTQNRLVASFYN